MIRYTAAMDATKAGRGAGTMIDTMFDIGKMSADEQIMMMGRFGDDAERLMSLGFANPNSRGGPSRRNIGGQPSQRAVRRNPG